MCLAYHQIVKDFASILEPAAKNIWESPARLEQTEECSGQDKGQTRRWKQHKVRSYCLNTCFWKLWGACALEDGKQWGLKIGWKEVILILFTVLWGFFSTFQLFPLVERKGRSKWEDLKRKRSDLENAIFNLLSHFNTFKAGSVMLCS